MERLFRDFIIGTIVSIILQFIYSFYWEFVQSLELFRLDYMDY